MGHGSQFTYFFQQESSKEELKEFPAMLSASDDSDSQPSTNTEVLEACAEAVVAQSVGKLQIQLVVCLERLMLKSTRKTC